MSDALAVAVWRAKMARQTPSVVVQSPIPINELRKQLNEALDYNEKILDNVRRLRSENGRLAGELGGLRKALSSKNRIVGIYQPDSAAAVCPPLFTDILSAVARQFDVERSEIRSSRRALLVTLPRQVAMYLCKKLTPHSLTTVGRWFGRDHSTVLSGIRKIDALRLTDSDLNEQISRIERIFEREAPCEDTLQSSSVA